MEGDATAQKNDKSLEEKLVNPEHPQYPTKLV